MNWKVTIDGSEKIISLPDSIPHNHPFDAKIGKKSVTLRWNPYQQSLEIIKKAENNLEVSSNKVLRKLSVSKFKEDPSASCQIEYWSSTQGIQDFKASVEMHVAGGDQRAQAKATSGETIRSQITGKVLKILVKEGDEVNPTDAVLIVEAMKMENRIYPSKPGKVQSIKAKEGTNVSVGDELAKIE